MVLTNSTFAIAGQRLQTLNWSETLVEIYELIYCKGNCCNCMQLSQSFSEQFFYAIVCNCHYLFLSNFLSRFWWNILFWFSCLHCSQRLALHWNFLWTCQFFQIKRFLFKHASQIFSFGISVIAFFEGLYLLLSFWLFHCGHMSKGQMSLGSVIKTYSDL